MPNLEDAQVIMEKGMLKSQNILKDRELTEFAKGSDKYKV